VQRNLKPRLRSHATPHSLTSITPWTLFAQNALLKMLRYRRNCGVTWMTRRRRRRRCRIRFYAFFRRKNGYRRRRRFFVYTLYDTKITYMVYNNIYYPNNPLPPLRAHILYDSPYATYIFYIVIIILYR